MRAAAVPDIYFFHITIRQVQTFVGRPLLHKKMQIGFRKDLRETQSTQTVAVVYGLGGAGKSQLVVNYVQEVKAIYSGVLWIDASNRDSIERDFGYLYRLLFKIPPQNQLALPNMDVLILQVRDWFVRRAEKFLFVFDGADNIDDPKDTLYVNLNDFIPPSASVDVILTTRIWTARRFGSFSIEVHEMNKDEALTLLCNSSGLTYEHLANQQDEVERIIGELGYFALAINLAGAYISNTPGVLEDLSQYLPEYHRYRKQLLDQKSSRLLDQYSESVLSTWEVSFEAITRQSGIAANLLIFLAFLNGADIFPELFDIIGAESTVSGDGEGRAGGWEDAICYERALESYDIKEAFSTLRKFSLVRWMPGQAAFSMHKLVHAWGHDRLGVNEQIGMIKATAHFLQERLLYDLGSVAKKERYSGHLMTNFSIMSQLIGQSDFAGMGRVCLSTLPSYANFPYALGRWSNEAKIEHYISKLASKILGSNHPYTILATSKYAGTLGNQGKLNEAAGIQKEVLDKKSTRILGAEHPSTISATSYYANTLGDQGKHDEAVELKKKV